MTSENWLQDEVRICSERVSRWRKEFRLTPCMFSCVEENTFAKKKALINAKLLLRMSEVDDMNVYRKEVQDFIEQADKIRKDAGYNP